MTKEKLIRVILATLGTFLLIGTFLLAGYLDNRTLEMTQGEEEELRQQDAEIMRENAQREYYAERGIKI